MDKITDNTSGFHFTIVDNYILSSAKLSAVEQIVYIHLKKHAQQTDRCFPGIKSLAEAIDSSPNTIRKTLRLLKEKGFIDIRQRSYSSNEYILLPYPEYSEEIKGCGEKDEEISGIGGVLRFYQNNINPVYGSMEREKLINWFNAFQGRGEILIKAIEISALQGVHKFKYIEGILMNWMDAGVKTIEQCEAYQKQWEKKRRDRKNGSAGNGTGAESDSEGRYDFSKLSDL